MWNIPPSSQNELLQTLTIQRTPRQISYSLYRHEACPSEFWALHSMYLQNPICSSMLSTISVIISEPYLHKQLLWNQSSILEHTNLLFSKDYWSLYLFGKCITGNGSCCLRQMQKIIATFKKSKVTLRIFIPTTYRKGTYVSKFENECCPDLIWFRFL
jgi:hypothetical protein